MDTKLQNVLEKANKEVKNAAITDPELKKIAFSKAIDYYLYGTKVRSQDTSSKISPDSTEKESDGFWGGVETSAGIEESKLKDVYAVRDDQILLIISSVPGEKKADRQRNLAVLILFAYQEGLGREWVSSTLVAEAANHSKLYDTSKFAKNLKSDWIRTKGVRKGLKYKLSGPGTSHAKSLLTKLTE